MCSNTAARLTRIDEAIGKLAAEAAEAAEAGGGGPDQVAGRLAAIWAMMAELDPGLARKLRGYTGGEPAAGAPGPPP